MSRYEVQLTSEAEDNLADIWLKAADRQAVTEAEAAIHDLLCTDPAGRGSHVAEGLFRIRYAPLVVFFSIDDVKRVVEVSRVWRPS
jgi:mRNA-degrading endonuclease RelE of RelBE toxin-antitoxin system